MKKILYFLLLFPIWLSAQINESDSLKIKADLSLTGFWQGGNVETLIFFKLRDVDINLKLIGDFRFMKEHQRVL